MYPALPNSFIEIEKTLTIPLSDQPGRQVDVFITAKYEGDTNATIYDDDNALISWVDTGDDLTADELNTVIIEPDTTLWDWIMDNLDSA